MPVSTASSPRPDFTPLFLAALLGLTLFVFVPAHLYLANKSAVLISFGELIAFAALPAAAATGALAALIRLAPISIRPRLAAMLLGVSILGWIHAYVLVWPYSVLDGGTIDWSAYTKENIVDAALWLAVLAPLLWFAQRIYPHILAICASLLALQAASLAISTLRSAHAPLDFFKRYYVEKDSAFEFSTGKNVIVFVLDEFQTDVFAEAVLPHPEYRKYLSGFTYFPNTTAGANFTEFALPALLTGHIYDNHIPREEFLRQAYLKDSLPAVLKRHGFEVDLFPWRGFANEAIYYDEAVASNFKRRPLPLSDRVTDTARLIDLGLFRAAPQFAKRYIHNDSRWRCSLLTAGFFAGSAASTGQDQTPAAAAREIGPGFVLDSTFLGLARENRLPGEGVVARRTAHVFKFYHLAGMHVPVKMKRDLNWGQYEYNRANYSEQAQAFTIIIGTFLDELRRHQLYDNSMIVIMGDHGSGRDRELYVNPDDPQRTAELDRTATQNDFQRDKARGLPLLLVKRFGESGDIKVSKAPASLIDIPATVWAALDIKHAPVTALTSYPAFHGVSVFDLPLDQRRERYYGATRWSGDKKSFTDSITLYRIQGDGWSDPSWSLAGVLEPPSSPASQQK